MTLQDAVERAIQRMAVPGIEGWGLNNPDSQLFDQVTVGEPQGCTSETCNHYSHGASAPTLKLVPLQGQLVALGGDEDDSFFALILGEDTLFFRKEEGRAQHAYLRLVDPESVPEYLLAQLGQEAE